MGLINETSKSYYQGADGVQLSGDEKYGNYQYITLEDIINQFIISYVGENKIISKVRRTDIQFHAMRALQELSYDTLNRYKSLEYTVPATLKMPLPQDFVNHVKVSYVDDSGIMRVLYPSIKSFNPTAYQQNTDGSYKFETNTYVDDPTVGYQQYGITSTGLTSPSIGTGDFEGDNLIPKFKKETRIAVTNTSGYNNRELVYGPGSGMRINFFTAGHDIEVGMTIFGPGIPPNSTVATVGDSNNSNLPGMGITFTNPEYENWLLNGSVGTNPGRPTDTQQLGEEVIFVNLNKQSDTQSRYKTYTAATTSQDVNYDNYDDDIYLPREGGRFGISPENAQANGTYYIDQNSGCIYFSSNISGLIVILNYISDSLGNDNEMIVHKFAEEAMYKHIAHAILATRANTPEYLVNRFKKEKFAAKRNAKLRLSNIKLEELSQILRNKSKHIKH
tara:strand:+ start:938 stop:2278 length:1341 start_codon:yes stop_codon:yes gene_type:complete